MIKNISILWKRPQDAQPHNLLYDQRGLGALPPTSKRPVFALRKPAFERCGYHKALLAIMSLVPTGWSQVAYFQIYFGSLIYTLFYIFSTIILIKWYNRIKATNANTGATYQHRFFLPNCGFGGLPMSIRYVLIIRQPLLYSGWA